MAAERRDGPFYPHSAQLLKNTPDSLVLPNEDSAKWDLVFPNPDIDSTDNDKRPSDTFKQYLREIARTPLLTAKEEVQFALQIENARTCLAKNMPSLPSDVPLSKALLKRVTDEKPSLLPLVQAGVEARECLVKANLRLVVSIAKSYMGKGLLLPDLVEEGNLGLFKTIEKFDPRRGFKFSTYATWWIKQAISRALSDQARIIRLPTHVVEQRSCFIDAKLALTQELGEPPTYAQIAARLNDNLRKGKPTYTAERVSSLFQAFGLEPVPMSTCITEEGIELGDILPDQNTNVSQKASISFLRKDLFKQLENLSPREQLILKLRFGLTQNEDVEPPLTLEEIGERTGLTRERVRQIEAEALAKLRKSATIGHLREYLE